MKDVMQKCWTTGCCSCWIKSVQTEHDWKPSKTNVSLIKSYMCNKMRSTWLWWMLMFVFYEKHTKWTKQNEVTTNERFRRSVILSYLSVLGVWYMVSVVMPSFHLPCNKSLHLIWIGICSQHVTYLSSTNQHRLP